ncbi:MAG: DUF4190 domain-containing protein [Candidatus Dormibacteria bacterium]
MPPGQSYYPPPPPPAPPPGPPIQTPGVHYSPDGSHYWDGSAWRPTGTLGGPPASNRTTNGMAIASMVLGIIWIYWIGSILALVFGYVALGQIRSAGGRQAGRGMAIAGVALGWVGVGTLVLLIVFAVIGAVSSHTASGAGAMAP